MTHGVLYPNGEFTVSTLAPRLFKPDRLPKRESLQTAAWEALVAAHVEVFGVQQTIEYCERVLDKAQKEKMLDVLAGWQGGQRTIGLSNVLNSRQHRNRALRGQMGISSHARRLVRNASHGLEASHVRTTLSFITLTLPPMTGADFKTFMKEHWSRCVKRFFDSLSKRLTRTGLSLDWVGVTEIQEKRFLATGIPYPHLHVLSVGAKRQFAWIMTPLEIRQMWASALTSTGMQCFVNGNLHTSALENVKMPRGSLTKYLSKYLSKGCTPQSHERLRDWYGYLPSNWHHISQSMKDWVKRHTRSGEEVGEFLLTVAESNDREWCGWLYPIDIPMGDVVVRVGYAGKIVESRLNWLLAALTRQQTTRTLTGCVTLGG